MAFEVEIDGVHVKVTPLADVELRKGMGGLCKFRCRCGLGEVRITRRDLEEIGGSSPLSAVKYDVELTREWNELQRRASRGEMDFFDYEEEMGLWMERRRIRGGLEALSEYETTLRVRCPFCGRTYRFLVKMENPLRALEAMDPIEAFKKLSVDLRRHARPLARVGFKRGFGSPEVYLQHLKRLAEEEDLLEKLSERLRDEVEALFEEPRTEFTLSQLRRLKRSIERFAAEYKRGNETLLGGELKALISDFRG